jgi:hypothetical protein
MADFSFTITRARHAISNCRSYLQPPEAREQPQRRLGLEAARVAEPVRVERERLEVEPERRDGRERAAQPARRQVELAQRAELLEPVERASR